MSSTTYIGGAGIVARHLKALGADVTLTSVLGDDKLGKFVKREMKSWGIKSNFFLDNTRCTTLKERYWANNYKLIQVDTVDNHNLSTDLVNRIKKKLKIQNLKQLYLVILDMEFLIERTLNL